MKFSTNPITGIVVGVLLVLAGLYLTTGGGTTGLLGVLFVLIGAASVGGNALLWWRSRR